MLTFKEYLRPSGNYVCINCQDLSGIFELHGHDGSAPHNKDYHCTLMYSVKSNIDCKSVLKLIDTKQTIIAKVVGFACFDSEEKETTSLVALLESPELLVLNAKLVSMGMVHSYPKYEPHVTLLYNLPSSLGECMKDELHKSNFVKTVKLSQFKSEPINKEYV